MEVKYMVINIFQSDSKKHHSLNLTTISMDSILKMPWAVKIKKET